MKNLQAKRKNLLKRLFKPGIFLLMSLFAGGYMNAQSVVVTVTVSDNCMNPLPNGGTYTASGSLNGKTMYVKGANLRIVWTGTQWELQADDPAIGGVTWVAGWYNTNNTATPPADCWAASFGCFPIVLSGPDAYPAVTVSSIALANANPTSSSTVNYTVTFSGTINSLTASNFSIATTNTISGASVSGVTQTTGNVWNVAVNTGTGDGNIRLDLANVTGASALICTLPFIGASYNVFHTTTPVTLSAGDIAFTGYNSSSATIDDFSFVVLRPGGLPAGTQIMFTDNGWNNVTSACTSNEGVMVWTASSAVAQFSSVWIQSNLSPLTYTANLGSAAKITASVINLSNAGDQVLAFQGNLVSPTFISAIHMNSDITGTLTSLTSWDDFANGVSTSRSAIPPGLTSGTNAVIPVTGASAPYTEFDNAVYNCTGSIATSLVNLRTSINDRNNWSEQDATAYTIPPTCTFSVAAALTATQSQVNLTCNGVCTGSGTVVASGGTAPYTYSWSPSGGSGATASSLCASNYTCTITDNASASITKTFTITQPPAITTTPVSQTNISCNGGSNGAASMTASGGTGTLTYNWTPGTPTGDGTGSVTGLTAQVYTITVTDANACTATRTFNITQPPVISSSVVSQTNVACNGGSNGAATISASGGAGSFTYNWNPGNPTGDGTVSVTGLTAGTWTCTITDANSCTKTQTVNITSPSAITVTPVSQTNIACFGGSNGAAQVSASGGAGGFTYNWNPGNPSGDGTASVTGLTAGTWTCTVTDANSCTSTGTFNLTSPTAIVVTAASQTNVSTFGGNNGAASINTPTGGVGGYTYNWTPGNPTGDGTTSVTGLTAGTWTCTVTDANSCTATQTFIITQPAALGAALNLDGIDDRVNIGSTISTVLGTASALTIEAWVYPTDADAFGCIAGNYSTSGGGMQFLLRRDGNAFTFWTDRGTGFTNVTTPNVVAFNTWQHVAGVWNSVTQAMQIYVNGVLQATTTGVVGTTLNTNSNPVMIGWNTINEQMQGSVDEIRIWNRALCQSEISNNMNCEIPTTGSGLLANYHFNQGAAGGSNPTVTTLNDASGNAYNGSLLNFTLNGATSNWITPGAVVSGTSCGVFTPPSVIVTPVSQTNVSCFSGSNGAASVSASGGSGLIYDWTPGNPTGDGTFSVTGLTAGTWTCTVTNNCGGINTTTFNITQPASVVSGSTVVASISCNGGTNGAIDLTPTGGTPGYTYNWGGGITTQDRTGLTAGAYSVTIADANGCTVTVNATITQPTAVSGTTVVSNVACFGLFDGQIDLTPTGGLAPYTFNWGMGIATEDRGGLTANTYTVQITDANGCTATISATVTEPSPLVVNASATTILCNGGTADVTVSATGGTAAYTGTGTSTVTAGIYNYSVTDAKGCTANTDLTITEPSVITGSQSPVLCAGGSVTVGANTYTTTGTYTDVLTAFNGCDSTVTTNLTVNPAISGSQSPVICAGQSITVGSNTYNTSGTYTDVVTSFNGCDSTITTNLTVNPAISGSQSPVLCAGESITVGSSTYNTTGNYTNVLTAFNGCDSTVTTNLTVNAAIDISTTLIGFTSTANASGAGVTYQWIDCDNGNAMITGETNQSFTAIMNGNYAVIVMENSCSDTSNCEFIFVEGISNSSTSQINIYPNPFTDQFVITSSNIASEDVKISVTTLLGQKIYTAIFNGKQLSIDMNEQPKGIYLVKVESKTGVMIKKIIKE
jgi:hypothetical protein